MFKTANDVTLVEGYNQGNKHFLLRLNGISDCVCSWYSTKEWEGLGTKRRQVTHPRGAIKVRLSQTRSEIVLSLDDAKALVANHYNNTCLHR